jgi:hypothetical protein
MLKMKFSDYEEDEDEMKMTKTKTTTTVRFTNIFCEEKEPLTLRRQLRVEH